MILDELEERLLKLKPEVREAAIVGSFAERVRELDFQINEKNLDDDTDIDLLFLYDISRDQFREEMDLYEESGIKKFKEEVTKELGEQIYGYKIDPYLIFDNNREKYGRMLEEDGNSIEIYQQFE